MIKSVVADDNMRTYEKSHPWITFTANFDRASTELWMLLGEAISKCEHIAGVPLAPKIAEDLHRIYLAKGVHATTAIEGNTLSEEDVRARIEGKRSLPESKISSFPGFQFGRAGRAPASRAAVGAAHSCDGTPQGRCQSARLFELG